MRYRSMIIPSKFMILAAVFGAGCSATTPVEPALEEGPRGPVAAEKLVFSAASSFYCEKQRWPTSWDELQQFHAARNGARNGRAEGGDAKNNQLLSGFVEPTLSSPRAILLSVSYKNQAGATRTASFIAPPYCGDSERRIDPREVSIAGGGIVFRLPSGFEIMKGADVQAYWKAPPYPDAAWVAKDGPLIAIRFGDIEVAPEQVGEVLHELTEAYESSVSDLTWRIREVQMIGDRAFLRHEFENVSTKGRLVNVVLSSSFGGFLFAITVTGPAEQSDRVLRVAAQLEDSLKVR